MKKGLIVVGLFLAALTNGAAKINNFLDLRRTYKVAAFDRAPLDQVKVAVLDRGFEGLIERDERNQVSVIPGMLPASATVVEDYTSVFPETAKTSALVESSHGRSMAQIIWAMADNNPLGPQIYLLNANGSNNFRQAVRYAREVAKVDIILFSQNYENGGNFRGDGWVNAIVNEATAQGILWINAAGNYAGRVYNGPAPEKSKTLLLRSNVAENKVVITVAWSRASEDENMGTDLDYDVELRSKRGVIKLENFKQVRALTPKEQPEAAMETSSRKSSIYGPVQYVAFQPKSDPEVLPTPAKPAPTPADPLIAPPLPVEEDPFPTPASPVVEEKSVLAPPAPKKALPTPPQPRRDLERSVVVAPVDNRPEDLNPYERFDVTLDQNDQNDEKDVYQITVVRKSGAVNKSDYLRVTVMSPSEGKPFTNEYGKVVNPLVFQSATQGKEIMVPADNPNVITVGDLEPWSASGPTMDGRTKPEIRMSTSMVSFNTGFSEAGTSHAAAILAGIVAQMKATSPLLSREDVIRFIKSDKVYANIRYPVQGTLPNDAQPVSPETFKAANPKFAQILSDLETRILPGTIFETFRTTQGDYILGMTQRPQGFNTDLTRFDVYLTTAPEGEGVRRSDGTLPIKVVWASRNRAVQNGYRASYPWEINPVDRYGQQMSAIPRMDFVQLRLFSYKEERLAAQIVNNVWFTPTLEQMKKVIAERI